MTTDSLVLVCPYHEFASRTQDDSDVPDFPHALLILPVIAILYFLPKLRQFKCMWHDGSGTPLWRVSLLVFRPQPRSAEIVFMDQGRQVFLRALTNRMQAFSPFTHSATASSSEQFIIFPDGLSIFLSRFLSLYLCESLLLSAGPQSPPPPPHRLSPSISQ